MSLRQEINSYTDVNGYISPYPVHPSAGRSSDNATMFTSEYYILLAKRYEDVPSDADRWNLLIANSSLVPGLTVRYPGDTSTDAPDNLYAILAAAKVLRVPRVAQAFLDYGKANYGWYNPSNPHHIRNKDGTLDWSNFQWRQPQLVFAALCAANNYHWLKFWHLPLALYTAIVIATSCIDTPVDDADSRRLAWLLVQSTQDSLLCSLASKLWYDRLLRDYGSPGMREVAKVYYWPHSGNPFAKYWVT